MNHSYNQNVTQTFVTFDFQNLRTPFLICKSIKCLVNRLKVSLESKKIPLVKKSKGSLNLMFKLYVICKLVTKLHIPTF